MNFTAYVKEEKIKASNFRKTKSQEEENRILIVYLDIFKLNYSLCQRVMFRLFYSPLHFYKKMELGNIIQGHWNEVIGRNKDISE